VFDIRVANVCRVGTGNASYNVKGFQRKAEENAFSGSRRQAVTTEIRGLRHFWHRYVQQ
jgi:hypothetical protein